MQLDQAAERIESLKAGILAATAAAIGGVCLSAVHHFLLAQVLGQSQMSEIGGGIGFHLVDWLKIASILLSGFLFGVTYRYIVRQDHNLQLKAGAVMAFGLIRGLAQTEMVLDQIQLATITVGNIFANQEIWQIGAGVGESVILFALAAAVLDQAIDRGWIKAFTTF